MRGVLKRTPHRSIKEYFEIKDIRSVRRGFKDNLLRVSASEHSKE